MSFSDLRAAMAMRGLITSIAEDAVKRLRPEERIGKVFSYDTNAQLAQIYFPGETIDSLVTARFALDRVPSTAMASSFDFAGYDANGDIVRVAGKPGAYYISDYISGIPQVYSERTSDSDLPTHSNPHFDLVSMSQVANANEPLPAARLMPNDWHIYWGSANSRTESDTQTSNNSGYSLKVTVPTSSNQHIGTSAFAVTGGQQIRVKVQAKSTGPHFGISVLSDTEPFPDFLRPNVHIYSTDNIAVPADNAYREYEFVSTVPEGDTRARVDFHVVNGTGGAGGDLWLDDSIVTILSAGTNLRPVEKVFTSPSATWSITHNLGQVAVVVVTEDGNGEDIIGEVTYVNENTVEVDWYFPMTGIARVFP